MSASAAVDELAGRDRGEAGSGWLARVVSANSTRWIAGACLLYLALEIVYVLRLPLVMDEFQGAAAVDRLSRDLPYRDFRPYKTVLGYYLQWPAMQLGWSPWTQMLAVKLATALAASVALAAAALRLRRHFEPAAVVLGLGLLLAMSTFLERSAALRVDLPTALFGLFSLLAILDRRALRAGMLAGLSFLVSQKGIYFALAGGMAFGLEWLFASRDRVAFERALRFAAGAVIPPALYFALFAWVSSGASVGEEVLLRPRRIAFEDLYSMRDFWFQTVFRNPYFYAVMLFALGGLAARRRQAGAAGERDRWLLGYGATLLALCLWHKQPWPYFFVFLVPTGFVLAASFFDREIERRGGIGTAMAVAYLALGLAWPLTRVPRVVARDSGFQQHMVEVASIVLDGDDRYLAGLSFLSTHRQVPGFSWLDGPRLEGLAQMETAELAEVAARVREAKPKLVVWNYRIARLPEPLQVALHATFAPLFGNLQIYSPLLPAGESIIELWHAGSYALSGPGGPGAAPVVRVDGRPLAVDGSVELEAGAHRVSAGSGYRLHLVPEGVEDVAIAAYAGPRRLFEDPYTY